MIALALILLVTGTGDVEVDTSNLQLNIEGEGDPQIELTPPEENFSGNYLLGKPDVTLDQKLLEEKIAPYANQILDRFEAMNRVYANPVNPGGRARLDLRLAVDAGGTIVGVDALANSSDDEHLDAAQRVLEGVQLGKMASKSWFVELSFDFTYPY